jgi:hypothetical protein
MDKVEIRASCKSIICFNLPESILDGSLVGRLREPFTITLCRMTARNLEYERDREHNVKINLGLGEPTNGSARRNLRRAELFFL